MDLKNFRLDTEKADDGVWVDMGNNAQIKIAWMNNPAYVKLFTQLSKPYARLAKQGQLPEDKAKTIMAEVMSKTILLDWQGLKIDDQVVPYSQKKAQEILLAPEYAPFFTFVVETAQDEANFRQEEIEQELGESQPA